MSEIKQEFKTLLLQTKKKQNKQTNKPWPPISYNNNSIIVIVVVKYFYFYLILNIKMKKWKYL